MCVTTTEGGALCSGANHLGSLGHDLDPAALLCNSVPYDPVPKRVQAYSNNLPLTQVAEVHMGAGVACARLTDGTVLCWGDNSKGALGQGAADPTEHKRAMEVPALKAEKLDLRGQTPCAIVADSLLCWGDGQYGQLDSLGTDGGCGTAGCRALAYPIPGMMPVRNVSAGAGSIATIKNDATLWMWGRNDSAELAVPNADPANQPCGSGSVCVPQPKQITSTPPLD
jgi:hypothetical protein